ncbi:MAG TPA: hypothetical protein VEQ10_14655 [Vicinamibacteria bacterium]|nr:hypothetical protein [Vicinamibacteria bacterium]
MAERSSSFTQAIRLEAASILSRTPALVLAMGFVRLRPGRRTGAAPAVSSYSSFFSSSWAIAAESGR